MDAVSAALSGEMDSATAVIAVVGACGFWLTLLGLTALYRRQPTTIEQLFVFLEARKVDPSAWPARMRETLAMEKEVISECGMIGALTSAIGFEGMHTDREISELVRLCYTLVLLLGICTVVAATIIAAACNKPFSDDRIAAAARCIAPYTGVPSAMLQLQLSCLMLALGNDSGIAMGSKWQLVFRAAVALAVVGIVSIYTHLRIATFKLMQP